MMQAEPNAVALNVIADRRNESGDYRRGPMLYLGPTPLSPSSWWLPAGDGWQEMPPEWSVTRWHERP